MYFHTIIPNNKEEFKFKYFNLIEDNFKYISIPIVVKDSSVSTQIDLNPKDSPFRKYKIILYGSLFLLFLIIYIWRKRFSYVLVVVIFGGLFLYEIKPIGKVTVKGDVKIRILPTKNSTIILKTTSKIKAEKILQRNGFIKIIFNNNKIGWIKNEDIF
jgi:hypothetical protein